MGFVLGSLAGNALFPTQLPGQSGPRLSDNQTTTSILGSPVPIVFGTAAVAGTFMWLAKVVETQTTQHSGGKGAPEQSNTTFSYTQSVAIGLCEGPITGVSRIWENGKLVYDSRAQLPGESTDTYSARITAAGLYAAGFTLHLGDETQTADATIEAVEGFGNVPAFRGLAYIVYPNRKLSQDQGLRHPAFRFEINGPTAAAIDAPVLLLHFDGNLNDSSGNNYPVSLIGTGADVVTSISKYGSGSFFYPGGIFGASPQNGAKVPYSAGESLNIFNDEWTIECFFYLDTLGTSNDYLPIFTMGTPSGVGSASVCWGYATTGQVGFVDHSIYGTGIAAYGNLSISVGQWHHYAAVRHNNRITLFVDGVAQAGTIGITPSNYTFTSPSALLIGATGGWVGSAWSDSGFIDDFIITPSAKYTADFTPSQYVANTRLSLGQVIAPICARVGLDNVDVTDMDAVFIDGYSISNLAAARDILTPLRSVGFFDCVESGTQLKFVGRGKAIVASLTADDFGAFDSTAGSTPGPAITTTKAQDVDLPLQTRVHYFATSRDYEAGEQLSPNRQTTKAVNIVDVELAVCMPDDQAAKIAEVLWADAWAERYGHNLAVDQAWSQLEPGDCIEVPVDSVTRRLRIVSEGVSSGVLRTLTCVRDDDDAYVSHAVASPPARIPQTIKIYAPTNLFFLDLPALADSDDNAGFYAAAASQSGGNTWGGCVVFRSADGGATFSQLGSITNATSMGLLHSAVPASDWHTFDDVTTITVDVLAGVTFESRTDAAVLNGANAAAMGVDGRWEVVQFATATQLSSTQWRLSRLLRGRRGTEHNIDSSQSGDAFVMLSTGSLIRMPLQTAEINANRIYKAVTIATPYATGIDQTFAGHGKALVPFSSVDLAAKRETGDDLIISWVRRGRLGRTWMSGVDIPLSEATEAYQVDIYTLDSPHVVVRTLSVSHPVARYTAAQQSADFGSDAATHIMVAVYQMSATVGRGTPAVEILTIG